MRGRTGGRGRCPSVAEVDAALRAFWAGRPEPMDRLIAGPDGGPPYVAARLLEFVRACSTDGFQASVAERIRR